MNNYHYILLDWDGNLAKTLDIWLEAFKQVLLKRGVQPSNQEIAQSFGAALKHMEQWGVKDIEAALEEAEQIARERLPSVELYPDALEVLESLHNQGKHMALTTSSFHRNIEQLLNKYNMIYLFEAIVAADDTTHHKPHPEPLERALTLLGGSKEKPL